MAPLQSQPTGTPEVLREQRLVIDEMGLVRVDGLVVEAVLARIAVCAPTVTSRPSFWVAVGGLAVAAGFRQ